MNEEEIVASSCPICLNGFTDNVNSDSAIIETACNHYFCEACWLNYSLHQHDQRCPVCRGRTLPTERLVVEQILHQFLPNSDTSSLHHSEVADNENEDSSLPDNESEGSSYSYSDDGSDASDGSGQGLNELANAFGLLVVGPVSHIISELGLISVDLGMHVLTRSGHRAYQCGYLSTACSMLHANEGIIYTEGFDQKIQTAADRLHTAINAAARYSAFGGFLIVASLANINWRGGNRRGTTISAIDRT